MKLLFRHPRTSGVAISVVTLAAGASTVILADLGGPLWMFLILFTWLVTIGLPTTLAVLCVATIWGRTGTGSGFLRFVVIASLLAIVLQAESFAIIVRLCLRHKGRKV